MNVRTLIGAFSVSAAAMLVNSARAEDEAEDNTRRIPAAVLERFDADKDGKLSDEERETAREALRNQGGRPAGQRMNEEMRKRFDANANGELEPDELAKAREEMQKRMADRSVNREKIIQRFDKDNDGKLNNEERAEMRRFVSQRRGGGGLVPAEREPRLSQSKLLEKFDENKDGELDAAEREQVLAELRKRRSE